MPKRVVAQRRKPRVVVKRNCRFCENKIDFVDFKDHDLLRRFQTEKGKIMPRRISGNCMRHQKMIAIAIKNARVMSLAL